MVTNNIAPYIKLTLLVVLLNLCFAGKLAASHEVGTARLSSPAATVNSTLFIQDNKYTTVASMSSLSTWGFYDKSFKNKLTLGIDRYNTTALADFVATVTVQISSAMPQALGGAPTVITKTLSVSYEGANDHKSSAPHPSIDQDVYSFSNGYKVITKILAISVTSSSSALTGSTLPANVYLQIETDAERFYPLPQNTTPFLNAGDISINYLSATDEFEVSWVRINGAEQYDLEWLWLDGEKNAFWSNNPQLDFRNNSTRVRTSQQSYRVSNVFEKGQVFFRLRGVGKASLIPNAYEKDAYTPWSWQDLTTISTGVITSPLSAAAPTSGTDRLYFVTLDGSPGSPALHEFSKNWQYKATYAEEGKKKEVISYFDGSLRSRQSVTKNNSDNNAIVGETYYDYNGRAAVQALPVPVEDAKIKFYQYNVAGQSGFNFDVNTHVPYTKKLFDEENSANTATSCAVFVAGLDPDYGSSKYYSDHNLNRQFAQGYVPNAENFPISQTEFTNDNTGRIAKQGGVGKTHQLGSGHETTYFYGSPEQIELDRLFGSEVGYNKHYKKNMVVDANGQVSISYIDQEGRTIATALSGQGPSNLAALKNTAGAILYPAPTATNVIDADLLNKVNTNDYDTDLDNNERVGDELTFIKKIIVPSASTYTISYDLKGEAFTYSCLPTNACYDCVYDLEIDIFDNCHNNPLGFTKITQTLGNILPPAGPSLAATSAYSLDAVCNQTVNFSTSQLNYSGNQLLVNLNQGEYTITKTLKINQQAMAYYLTDFLASPCVKQPSDFDHIKPDTSGCGLTCDECVAAIGSLASYTLSGKGTVKDWEEEVKVCREPCEFVSLCDAEYITMLADVSPGGQYGDWEDNQGNCNTSLHSVSVYNESNVLPKIKNFTVGYHLPNWRNPFLRKSIYQSGQVSDFEPEYRDDDGTISKVYVTKYVSGTTVNYLPPLKTGVTPTPVDPHNTGNGAQYYVKPQELDNVADFIANWQNSWAKSLVFYHPEYPYYDWCLKNTTNTITPYTVSRNSGTLTITGSVASSEAYDSLLMTIDDITAIASGDLLKLCDPGAYDPYWATGGNGYYYDHNNVYPSQTTGTALIQKNGTISANLTSPWNALYPAFHSRYNQYRGTTLSLPAFAALITTSCVIQYGQSPTTQLTCLSNALGGGAITPALLNTTGVDVILAAMPATLKNKYWDNFKSLYLSLKQEMQMEAAESYAMNGDYRGVNDGIGNPNFDPQDMSVPFTKYFSMGFFTNNADIFKQWFYPMASANEPQYCGLATQSQYANKIKRFPNATNALNLANTMPGGDPGATIYASTGLCPNAFYLQGLVNTLGVNDQLSSSTINLSAEPFFNQDLYKIVAGGTVPSSYTPANWTGSYSGGALTAQMQIGTNAACPFTLNFPAGSPFTFANTGNASTYSFLKLYQLAPGTTSGGTYNFTIKADITDVSQVTSSSPTYTTVILTGSTCIPLTGCSFTPPCEPNATAVALQKLMNAIAATGNMCSTGVLMSDVNIQPLFVNTFGSLLGSGNWKWQVNGSLPNFIIKDINTTGTNPNNITINLNNAPCTSGSQYNFSGITGSASGSNVFKVKLTTITNSGSSIATSTAAITGTVNLNGQAMKMGECSFDIGKCDSPEHLVREDMETFLSKPATVGYLQATSTNFTPNFNFGLNLRSRLADNYQTINPSTNATVPLYYYWKKNSAVSTSTLLAGAFVASTLTTVPSTLTPAACTFALEFANPASVSGQNLLSSGYTLSNFVLAPGPMVNNSTYNFSVTANFSGTPLVLKGTSGCFAMRACSECVSPSAAGALVGSSVINDFPCTGAPTYSVKENVGGATTPYRGIANCAVPSLISQLEYGISANMMFNDGNSTTWSAYTGGNGTSLFIRHATGSEFAYRQSYTPQHSCSSNKLKLKIHDKTNGSPQAVSDFSVRINGAALTNYSSLSLGSGWTEFYFANFPTTSGTPFLFEITDLNDVNDRNFAIDDIVIMPQECYEGALPCASNDSIDPFPEVEYEDPCVQYALDAAANEGDELYDAYIDSVKNAFINAYIKKCMGRAIENLYMKYNAGDYHFTLYYYDQAGNLVRTVPPEGVHVETNTTSLATIRTERANNTPYASKTYFTSHNLPTTYAYNALNQLVKQQTPDAGISQFWYDQLGRLTASQNANQLAKSTGGNYYYSYTRYDYLGRIAQVGEMKTTSNLASLATTAVAALASATNYPDNIALAKTEVTSTYYGDDASFTPLVSGSAFTAGSQEYLRSRVASVTIEDTDDNTATTYNHATHYSYDVHGNVKELIQENKDITNFGYQKLKKVNYSYDLISGKVNEVAYQKGLNDMFLHRYEYDADNRITAVYTSKNDVLWERDAKYFYYLHGPLARVEVGHDKVQAMDYSYTLHGWIKGVNSNILAAANDIGKDGNGTLTASATGAPFLVNKYNGRDVAGYSLTYYYDKNNGIKDYIAINGVTGSVPDDFVADVYASGLTLTPDLFNGNIRQMVTSYLDASSPSKTYKLASLLKDFTYDQLNRIETATSNDNLNAAANSWGTSSSSLLYRESFTYDQNGNILNAQRNGGQAGSLLAMDNLSYHYTANTNKLAYVTDAVSGDPYSTDISNQSAGNYNYDAIGNLIKDNAEGISNIDWTVYGKIKRITFSNGKPNLLFKYDASGNRVSKTAYTGSAPTSTSIFTYYVRDAQGNVMATYEQKPLSNVPQFGLAEQHIYGSSRLGLNNTGIDLTAYTNTVISTTSVKRTLGYRAYELSNHLGNVMTVVSDRKIAVDNGTFNSAGVQTSTTPDGIIDYFIADITSSTDYYVFGAPMPGRQFNRNGYRYGMNGQEKDDEIATGIYSAEYWEYDSRLGRRWNTDPIVKPFFSPYSTFANNPIYFVDPQGNSEWHPEKDENGTTVLAADKGDNEQTLRDYSTKTGINLSEDEITQFSSQINAQTAANNGEVEGLKLNSSKFTNLVGQTLMKMWGADPGCDIFSGDPNGGCSPTSFLRADEASTTVYNGQDQLGKVGGNAYRAWNKWNSKYLSGNMVDAGKDGAVGVVTALDLGYEVTAQQAQQGALKPGAILNLKMGSGGHSAIFHSYTFDDQGNINGFQFWQQYSNGGDKYLGTSKFDNSDDYQIRKAANFH